MSHADGKGVFRFVPENKGIKKHGNKWRNGFKMFCLIISVAALITLMFLLFNTARHGISL